MKGIFAHVRYFVALLTVLVVLILTLPANHIARAIYDLSGPQYHLLLLAVQLPLLIAWSIAMYGFTRLSKYSTTIETSPEGKDFRFISRGVGWIAWGLPLASLISICVNSIANSRHEFLASAIIIVNYLYVIVSLLSLSHFSTGIRALAMRNKAYISGRSSKLLVLTFVILGVVFCYITFLKLHNTGLGNSVNAYYLPNWLIGLTIAVPYLYAWFIGLLASYELVVIARKTPGVLYKHALQLLASGLVMIIISLSGLQYFRSIIPRTGHLVLGLSLFLNYAIYAVYIIGNILLIAGVKRMQKIEDA